ncbi:MAG: hemerythrin domain-containing protein [Rikenellaceae bacterium]
MKNKDNKYAIFTSSMKMADIILANYSLLTVLRGFGIQLGFGEKSLSEVCKKHDINESFFLLVCNVYTFVDYLPAKEEISKLDIKSLVSYLQSSHSYYLEEKMGVIENRLNSVGECCNEKHSKIIRTFFEEYKKELISHFKYEDETVFPYIKSLIKGETPINYHINQYEQNHSNIEDKLGDLKNILIKYLPDSYSSKDRNDVLLDIFLFEKDLNKHSLIEDKILIPFVREIELRYEK